MNRVKGRSRRNRSSTLLMVVGIAAGMLWVGTGTGCAGKRRAMKQKEAELARAAADESLDLAAIEKSSEARQVLDAQDPATWTTTPGERPTRSSGAKGSRSKLNGIYGEEPVVLEDPTFADAEAPKPRAAKGTKVARNAAPEAAVIENPTNTAPAVSNARELGTGEVVVNAPVQITPGAVAATIDGGAAETSGASRSREALAAELGRALRAGAVNGTPAYRDGVGLLALDLVEPGSVNTEIAGYAQTLAPTELASFESLRSLFKAISTAGVSTNGSPANGWEAGYLTRAIEDHLASVSAGETIAIRSSTLCTSVDGFGRYTPYPSTTFFQGRATPAIVYVALDHVTQTQLGSDKGGEWGIDLVQSAKVYHDKDNLVVTDLGEQVVRDTSRDRRRDFCVARRIDLPKLSLGRYNLKVTVRDQISGASAEATIPIQIVADPVLTSR